MARGKKAEAAPVLLHNAKVRRGMICLADGTAYPVEDHVAAVAPEHVAEVLLNINWRPYRGQKTAGPAPANDAPPPSNDKPGTPAQPLTAPGEVPPANPNEQK